MDLQVDAYVTESFQSWVGRQKAQTFLTLGLRKAPRRVLQLPIIFLDYSRLQKVEIWAWDDFCCFSSSQAFGVYLGLRGQSYWNLLASTERAFQVYEDTKICRDLGQQVVGSLLWDIIACPVGYQSSTGHCKQPSISIWRPTLGYRGVSSSPSRLSL